MKKRAGAAVLTAAALCLALLLARGPGWREEGFTLSLTDRSEGPVLGFHLEYALDGEPMGGSVVRPAKGGAIPKGKEVFWRFTRVDFPENAG